VWGFQAERYMPQGTIVSCLTGVIFVEVARLRNAMVMSGVIPRRPLDEA
jgi:hypothetical protein